MPKSWRDTFDTDCYRAELQRDKLIIIPINTKKDFKEKVENSWGQYKNGRIVSHEDLKKKYGL